MAVPTTSAHRHVAALLLSGACVLSGCATTAAGTDAAPPPPRTDPWEGFNRSIFAFNDKVDEVILKPVAEAYRTYVPDLVRTGIGNVYDNVADAWSAVNHLAQAKPSSALRMGMRVVSNTVFGLGGLLDPATDMGLEREPEDFGQTLGRWGVPPGPYLVLPLLGPSTLRDTAAWSVDRLTTLPALIDDQAWSNSLLGLRVVHLRSEFLSASNMLDEVALDRYSFLRDAYLARRRNQVYDGDPPEQPDEPDAQGAAPPGAAASATTPTAVAPAAPASAASAAGN